MEVVSNAFGGSSNKSWRQKRYQRVNGGYRKSVKTVTFGGRNRRLWKIKAIPRLRLKKFSPIRLWIKLKNAYIKMMLGIGGDENVFGSKKVFRVTGRYSMEEFQNRLLFEMSKNLYASLELATN